ncbi:MAG: hypothetical protein GX591_16640 [Planctomycetes bacterium]|nr:hypothetical protein [Planctomycetota bacterium]
MSFTGYRLYRGRGGPSSIDWTAPVASVPAGQGAVELAAAGHEPGATYTYALRPVLDGVESPDFACLAELSLDAAGQWPGPRPAPVTALAAVPRGSTVEVAWHWRAAAGTAAAERFAVFVGPGPRVATDSPAAVVTAEGDGDYSAEVVPAAATAYVAVRAETGPAASCLVTVGPVVLGPPPAMPAPLVDVTR